MDGGSVTSSEDTSSAEHKTLHQLFDELCPYYLQYGMTYDQYWHGDPWIARAFRKKWRLEQEEENKREWRQGLYIYDAVSTAIHNNFVQGQKLSYIEEPIRIFPMTEEEEQAAMRKEQERVMQYYKGLAARQRAQKARNDAEGE